MKKILITLAFIAPFNFNTTGLSRESQSDTAIQTIQEDLNRQLLQAIEEENLANVQSLLTQGANINARNQCGETLLYLAIESGSNNIAQALIASGADVNIPTTDGHTPLHLAASANDMSTIRALIVAGADINIKDTEGDTPIAVAHNEANYAIKHLLQNIANIEHQLELLTPTQSIQVVLNPYTQFLRTTMARRLVSQRKFNLAAEIITVYGLNNLNFISQLNL